MVNIAFVLGNGVSRNFTTVKELQEFGTVYACNAIYRESSPDYLIAVNNNMIFEIDESKYQMSHQVWTNYRDEYKDLEGFNYFKESKGWSSGPTALWLASKNKHSHIFILGCDFKGLENDSKVNNLFSGTRNYVNSDHSAVPFQNWVVQTITTIKEHPSTSYIRVMGNESHTPIELTQLSNYNQMSIPFFKEKILQGVK